MGRTDDILRVQQTARPRGFCLEYIQGGAGDLPDFKAPSRSASSIMPPRAQLMIITPSFICLKASLLMKPVVSFILGTWMVM
jgi:hypothetical protein